MPKRSKTEIEQAMAELQAELDAAANDDGAEIWVRRNGTEIKLTGDDKHGFLDKFFGDIWPAGGGEGEGEGGEGQGEGEGQAGEGQGEGEQGKGTRSYWGRT